MKIEIPKNSLRPLPRDARDFSLGAVFPPLKIEEVPMEDFMVAIPLSIKDQGQTDYCSAYAVTSASEDLSGNPEEWGADLRDACKSAVKFGSMAVNGFKFDKSLSRSALFIKEQWPDFADSVASFHKKETYFRITDGKYFNGLFYILQQIFTKRNRLDVFLVFYFIIHFS